MRFWRQNLKKEDGTRGLLHKRGAVWFGDDRYDGASLHWELCIPGRTGAEVRLDYDDEPLHFYLGFFHLFAWYLSINAKWAKRLLERCDPKRKDGKPSYEGKEWSVSAHGGTIYWNIGCSPDGWSKSDGWRHSSFSVADFLLGPHKYNSVTVQRSVQVAITMPEGVYTGTVELTRDTWKRSRWPFTKTVHRCRMEVPKPPMHRGKGENSWDCGDDGCFGLTCQAKTVMEAVTAYQESCYRDRARYGECREVKV